MAKLTILGTAAAVPDHERENTHFLLETGRQKILIDCAINPVAHLPRCGIDFMGVTDLVLTHFHPDHVSGAPYLLMVMWLKGRKEELRVYGLNDTLDKFKSMLQLYDWDSWPNFYPVQFTPVEALESALVFENSSIRVTASPVRHLIPAMGLRVDFLSSQQSFAYSCDTQPCEEVIRLAQGVEILFHETSGNSVGHTSPQQAGEIAQKAAAKKLYLVHYPDVEEQTWVGGAKQFFSGEVRLAKQLDWLIFTD
jgi:ribonuclease Z